jgi:hypothetical protein
VPKNELRARASALGSPALLRESGLSANNPATERAAAGFGGAAFGTDSGADAGAGTGRCAADEPPDGSGARCDPDPLALGSGARFDPGLEGRAACALLGGGGALIGGGGAVIGGGAPLAAGGAIDGGAISAPSV